MALLFARPVSYDGLLAPTLSDWGEGAGTIQFVPVGGCFRHCPPCVKKSPVKVIALPPRLLVATRIVDGLVMLAMEMLSLPFAAIDWAF